MSRRYDQKTNTFTPDGRLKQVEYAIEAINQTGSALGVLTNEGMILATEKQEVSHLLEHSKHSEKIYPIDRHIFSVVSGHTADANILINYAREAAANHRYQFQDNIGLEELIINICDYKQNKTQVGGQRPFGTAFLFAGYDKKNGFQLFSTDPSGNYAGWKATAIGKNNLAANSYLKQDYKENLTLEQGLDIAIKALVKTMDTSSPQPSKIEIVVISQQGKEVKSKSYNEKEVLSLLQKNGFSNEQMQQE
ncbi:unnamed protein product [Paramecium octaurelia]|uniref:Proteasome alpha-type subunits domain-containing protein n=1 Tax=Paramecium octaurelia TaxID=43137 RepID=A0A8S1TUY8_PAROT|nr:unnamed protein product [Paramecium octaurelia]